MRSRSWVPVLGWCAATLTSVALASVAMLPVLRTATPKDSSLVSIEQVRDSGVAQPTPFPSSAPVATAPTSASPTPERTSSVPPTRTRTSSPPPPSSPTKAPTKRPTTTTEDGWTVTRDGDGNATYVRSFRVEGGHTVIRMTENNVELVTATPSDGYSVATVQNTPDNLAVYFNEVNHSFVIHAVWFNDRPFVEISEIGE